MSDQMEQVLPMDAETLRERVAQVIDPISWDESWFWDCSPEFPGVGLIEDLRRAHNNRKDAARTIADAVLALITAETEDQRDALATVARVEIVARSMVDDPSLIWDLQTEQYWGYWRRRAATIIAALDGDSTRLRDGINDAIPYLGEREMAEPILRAALSEPTEEETDE